jgi:hypothetical protein
MTLKYMQGFETMRDDSDLRAQGWAPNPSKATARSAVMVPSVTGVSGFSLRPLGPYSSPLSSAVWGTATANDFGYFNTGITVNQAWLAGGVTFGFGIKFNGGVSASYGAGTLVNTAQGNSCAACFDGTKYWAIQLTGASTFNVATSTDLINWSVTTTQPGSINATTTLNYLGNGVVALIGISTETALVNVWYTSNSGVSWSSQTLVSPNIGGSDMGTAIATGNATYPHAIMAFSQTASGTSTSPGGIFVGTVGGSIQQVVSIPASIGIQATCVPRIFGGVLMFMAGTGAANTRFYSATASNPSLNTAGAWSTATVASSYNVIPTDIAYNPSSNLWVISTNNGIWTFPNTGAVGTPVAPTGAQTLIQRYPTVAMQNIFMVGTTMVCLGKQGHIVTSTDGVTWTESGGHLLPVGISGIDWRTTLYDGSRYVLFSDTTSGIVATTPDFQTNYAVQYALEPAEVAQTLTGTLLGTGLIPGNVPSLTTGQWSLAGSSNPAMLQFGPVSSGSRPFILDAYNTATSLLAGSVSMAQLYHYIELKCTKVTATANTFTVSMYVDGLLIGTSAAIAYGSTADTTSVFNMVFQRNGVFTAIDDIYVTLDDGVANTLQGPVGIVNIVAQRPQTDVQAQYIKAGSAPSNSLSVNQPALSSGSTNSVSSGTAGDKDIYGTTDNLPAGYAPKAIQVEAYYTKTSTSAPVVNLGVVSGGVEADGAQVTINSGTPTYVSQVFEKNPNGNVAWSASTVNAAQFVNNHVS